MEERTDRVGVEIQELRDEVKQLREQKAADVKRLSEIIDAAKRTPQKSPKMAELIRLAWDSGASNARIAEKKACSTYVRFNSDKSHAEIADTIDEWA
jgi:septal ring factor EnvC (AmiA/AmiB activator)